MCWQHSLEPRMESENDNSNFTTSSSDSNLASSSQNSTATEEDLDVFFFESDHVALKGNKDYQNMLRAICLLEAQRTQSVKDMDRLIECERECLSDPIGFVGKLQNRVDPGLPRPIRVASLPMVQWEKYTSSVDPLNLAARKHMTRKRRVGPEVKSEPASYEAQFVGPVPDPTTSAGPSEETSSGNTNTQIVRGRVKDESKSRTFNKLWTAEEQRRLEELLVEHQPEPVEARRWAKIAESLGNRTTQQVASRVQKYFIRLAKSGLPIPGRMPNLNAHIKKGGSHRHQRYNRFYFQPSTFLQSYEPPVYMQDGDDDYSQPGGMGPAASGNDYDVSDEDDVPPEKRLTVEYQELIRLKRLRRKKFAGQGSNEHAGYKCDQCSCEPIVGTRWHCADCPEEVSVDFCDECMDCQFDNGTHQPHHRLDPCRPGGQGHVDRDYLQFNQGPGDYNYLDPNYMPAS